MKKTLKVVSIALAIVLLITATPLFAFSASETSTQTPISLGLTSHYQDTVYARLFNEFMGTYSPDESFSVPGLMSTNVDGKTCTTMVPQGLCNSNNYWFISAYDSLKKNYSVIYVLSSDGSYLKTLVLSDLEKGSHVGGLAYDGKNLWISGDDNTLEVVSLSAIESAISKSGDATTIATKTINVNNHASYLTFFDGCIWVGTFSKEDGTLCGYKVNPESIPTTLTKQYTISTCSLIQGASFYKYNGDVYLLLSRSLGRQIYKTSQLRIYKINYGSVGKNGFIKKNNPISVIKTPPMIEGITIKDGKLYSLFESAAKKYRTSLFTYPIDIVVANNLSSDLFGIFDYDYNDEVDEYLDFVVPYDEDDANTTDPDTRKKIDLAFVIDTTGSMSNDIDTVKSNMHDYLNSLIEKDVNFRIAIVDYRDYPQRGYSEDYNYCIQCDFSSDVDTIISAIDNLSLGNGGDYEETLYSALIDGLSSLSWRKESGKTAIVMGDAPALDPEPISGYTLDDVKSVLCGKEISFSIDDIYPKTLSVFGLSAAAADDVNTEKYESLPLFTVNTGSYDYSGSCFKSLAECTDGEYYSAIDSIDLDSSIATIIDKIPEFVEEYEDPTEDVQDEPTQEPLTLRQKIIAFFQKIINFFKGLFGIK